MIKYSLKCDETHVFDGWFANSSAFEEQQALGLVECPHCGSMNVHKALMAPSVTGTKKSTDVEIIRPNGEVMQAREGFGQEVPEQKTVSGGGSTETPAPSQPETAESSSLSIPQESAMLTPQAQEHMKAVVEAVREFRAHVSATADNVGDKFAEEALKIHYGEEEARGIYGEASADDVKELVEEGVDFLPLPVLPEDQN